MFANSGGTALLDLEINDQIIDTGAVYSLLNANITRNIFNLHSLPTKAKLMAANREAIEIIGETYIMALTNDKFDKQMI
uniref:Uncharacterized protein n=1 Tax=Romanomermis culicivorax TaxID=13658 RepID=A0A915JQH0_ROMCU